MITALIIKGTPGFELLLGRHWMSDTDVIGHYRAGTYSILSEVRRAFRVLGLKYLETFCSLELPHGSVKVHLPDQPQKQKAIHLDSPGKSLTLGWW